MPSARIAIVDDEPAIGELLCAALSDAGIGADTFTTAQDLLNAIECQSYDLLLTDLMMPHIDGIELLKVLSEKDCAKRLVLMSGCSESARNSAASIATGLGFDLVHTFPKPLALATLVSVITDALVPPSIDVAALRNAIEANELSVQYQPVFRASPGPGSPLSYLEALVRWPHPRRGLLLPNDFLPLLEDARDWRQLTLCVLRQAAAQLAEWETVGFRPAVAVNLPPQILPDGSLPHTFGTILEEYGISTDRIIFEVTEEDKFSFSGEEIATLTRLKINGYKLSLDDFGTGHSSLRRLYDVPFDQIKIDVAFVSRASFDPRARSIVQSSVDLARALNLSVCAEGIDNVETLETMRECGCDHLQGFGLCRPAAAPLIELQYNHGRTLPRSAQQVRHGPAFDGVDFGLLQ